MAQRVIGVAFSEIHSEDRINFVKELNRLAAAKDCRLLIFNTYTEIVWENLNDYDGDKTVFQLIPYEMLSAMIVFPLFINDESITEHMISTCKERNIPVITIDKPIDGCVCFRNTYADVFGKVCDHVIRDHGARKLMMMGGIENNSFSEERVEAFRNALERNGIEFDKSLVGYGNFWEGGAREVMARWFETEGRPFPEAIICANDSMAIAVSVYLQDHGCKVPDDCIVTGFDGIAQSERCFPRLTTCRQDFAKIAEYIFEALEAFNEGKPYPEVTDVDFTVIKSQSCGCSELNYDNIHRMFYDSLWELNRTQERQHFLCNVQLSLTNERKLDNLCKSVVDAFVLKTCVIAVNDDTFVEPGFGAQRVHENAFSDTRVVVFNRWVWNELPQCSLKKGELAPDLPKLLEEEEPVVISVLHYHELVMGYCVLQTEVTRDAFENVQVFLYAMNASLGFYRSGKQLLSMNGELQHLYAHDHLTGLYNRRGFYLEFDKLMQSAEETEAVIIISVDLDGLKTINDTYGHSEGDQAIATVGNALVAAASDRGICARFGGDEFVVANVISDGEDQQRFYVFKDGFERFLDRYNRTVRKPYRIEASLGYFSAPLSGGISFDDLLRRADDAMYASKVERKKARLR